mgnify:CR=1 FL=1
MDVKKLEQDAVSLARRAVQCDQAGLVDTAISYYTEAADALLNANIAGSQLPNIREKVEEYLNRVQQLQANCMLRLCNIILLLYVLCNR